MKLVKARIPDEDYLYIFGKTKSKGKTPVALLERIVTIGIYFLKKFVDDKPVYIREGGKYVRVDLDAIEMGKDNES